MFVVGVVAFIWLLLIEYRLIAALIYKIRSCLSSSVKPAADTMVDSDVIEEMHRVNAMSKVEIESHSLVMQDMTKFYGKFLAVNQLSVGVDQ